DHPAGRSSAEAEVMSASLAMAAGHALNGPCLRRRHASECLQPLCAEYVARFLYSLRGWRLGMLECIANPERFPLETAHLVEGEHLDTLHVAELRRKGGDRGNVTRVIGESGNQHEADPDRQPACG